MTCWIYCTFVLRLLSTDSPVHRFVWTTNRCGIRCLIVCQQCTSISRPVGQDTCHSQLSFHSSRSDQSAHESNHQKESNGFQRNTNRGKGTQPPQSLSLSL